jgi:hypothetical protein
MTDPIYNIAPQQDISEQRPSTVCLEEHTPATIQAILLWQIRYHFSHPDRIEEPALRTRIWATDDGVATSKTSQLVVEPNTRWDPLLVNTRPGVFLARQQWDLTHLAMFGSAWQGTTGSPQVYSRAVSGSHLIRCVSTVPAEAEALAWEITGQFEGFSVNLGRDMRLETIRIAQLPGLAPVDESGKHWQVPVVATYVFHRNWQVAQEALPASKFTITVQES